MLSVARKKNNFAFQHFLITSPYPFLNSFSEHNSAAVRNILMVLGRITEQVRAKCYMQE